MNEEKKRDLQSVVAAGKKVIAKLKNYHPANNIKPYDGDDCFYTDYQPKDAEPEKEPENNAEPVEESNDEVAAPNTESSVEQPISEKDDEMLQKAYLYYEKINSKIDALKEHFQNTEFFNEFSKKAEGILKNESLKKEDLEAELDQIMVELLDKISVTNSKADEISSSVANLVEQSKSNYSSIVSSVGDVYKTTTDTAEIISKIEQALGEARIEISETHTNAMGLNKLIDSVFELKKANLDAKGAIEDMQAKQNKSFKIAIGIAAAVGVVSIATLAVVIVTGFIL